MRVWHNLGAGLDVVVYVEGHLFGVVDYVGDKVLGNHRWLATMMNEADVHAYIEWCDLYCDKEIWNRITKKSDEDDWV